MQRIFFQLIVAGLALSETSGAQGLSDLLPTIDLGAQAIGVVTRQSPAIHGDALTEAYLTQPAIMVDGGWFDDVLHLKATLNFEGLTLKRGELTPGIYGEGYIDRRHPHTYLHELLLTAQRSGQLSASLTAGKGFAPFGTDDPMARPFEKYPINHHLSQILERAVAIGAVRVNAVVLEAGLFNGDEPQGPGDAPNRSRYFDSWSSRVTLLPFAQGEIQGSYARVKSPENPGGGGTDQRKASGSVRLEDAQHSGYALLEWAWTGEYIGQTRAFTFKSILGETEERFGALRGGFRFERTERPDEERLSDIFRSPVPPPDLSITGRSRWTVLTARISAPFTLVQRSRLEPFVEIAHARVSPTLKPAGFDPKQFYGSSTLWTISAGAKISVGMSHMRMGRYGVATSAPRGMTTSGGPMNMNMSHP